MDDFLKDEAHKLFPYIYYGNAHITYHEDIKDDYDEEKYGEEGWTWVHKIGCLKVVDSNKLDFVYLFFGIEQEKGDKQFMGYITLPEGENNHIEATMKRLNSFLTEQFVIFGIK